MTLAPTRTNSHTPGGSQSERLFDLLTCDCRTCTIRRHNPRAWVQAKRGSRTPPLSPRAKTSRGWVTR